MKALCDIHEFGVWTAMGAAAKRLLSARRRPQSPQISKTHTNAPQSSLSFGGFRAPTLQNCAASSLSLSDIWSGHVIVSIIGDLALP